LGAYVFYGQENMIDLTWMKESLSSLALWQIFLAITVGFSAMYFSLAAVSLLLTRRVFPALGIGKTIDERPLRKGQIKVEILNSFVSILIFAGYGILTLWADQNNWLHIDWFYSHERFAIDLLLLFFWNELHFYCCHRALHHPWFYKKVHQHHHRSVVPTPFATYSFHWFEAFLLSSVMILFLLFYNLTFAMVLFFPLVSLFINNIGHMNYAIFDKKPSTAFFSSCKRHTTHHGKTHGNFGFFLSWFDRWFSTRLDE
jgi:lathosterol oxidase